jgi:two-component system alkaline phosphatase synthesis response regulator PhoP
MSKARILVVDDDPEIVTMLSTRLTKRGYVVTTANDGAQAIQIAKRELPDVILLDVMMPGKSGWEVARAIKQDPATNAVKIVMVSAIGEKTNEITAPIYGADAHVDKPFEFEHLERVIAQLLLA